MAANRARLTRIRSRLARRHALRACGGLALLGVGGAGSALVAFWAASSLWRAVDDGVVLVATSAAALLIASLAAAVRCLTWLWAPGVQPEGVLLPRKAAPALHRTVDRVGRRFGGLAIDSIRVTGDMNASILQRPRWGWIGPIETHLMIGLPLAHSVSARQFSAILAHEFAHLASQRQGVAAWGSHIRGWWFRVVDRCIEESPGFGSLFERWSAGELRDALVLARLEEFEADAIASQVVGARLLGETIVEVALKERFLSEDYWRKVMAQSSHQPQPSIRPYRDMGLGMVTGFRRPASGLPHLVGRKTERSSSMSFHPSLAERLRVLGVTPGLSSGRPASAAVSYLEPLLPALAWVFDRAWWQEARPAWQQRYRGDRRD